MLNRIVLIGRLTADPDFRVTSGGTPVANFALAVDRNFKNQQGEYETDFIRIVTWRRQAEFVSKNLQKGRLISVDGRLQVRKYQNQEGENRIIAEVVADSIQFLDKPRSSRDSSGPEDPPPEEPPVGDEDAGGDWDDSKTKDDLPF
jgi:single-strand DNA-binding protein